MVFEGMRVLAFFMMILVAGCGSFGAKEEIAEVQPLDTGIYLGTVAAINPDFQFVIVDATNAFAIPEGREAIVRRDNIKIGEVEFEKERTGQFAAARILEGDIQKGDEVYLDR